MTDINASLDGLESGASHLDRRVSYAHSRIDDLLGAIDTTNTTVDARFDDAEADIVLLDGRLDTAEGTLVSLDGRLDIAEPKIARAFLRTRHHTNWHSGTVEGWAAGTNAPTLSIDVLRAWNDFYALKALRTHATLDFFEVVGPDVDVAGYFRADVAAMVNPESTPGPTCRIIVSIYNTSMTLLGTAVPPLRDFSAAFFWQEISNRLTLPAGAKWLRPSLSFAGIPAAESVWIDDFVVTLED